MTCPYCGGNVTFNVKTDEYKCDTCSFPECLNCGEILNIDDDVAFLAETALCPYCEKDFGGNDD